MPTRRDVLASCSAVAGASALSGCSYLPFLGEDDDPSEYTAWIPDSGESYVRFASFRASHVAGIEGRPPGLVEDRLLGVETTAIDHFLTFWSGDVNLLRTSLDDEQLRSDLENEFGDGFEPRGDYEGYERYETGSSDRIVAIDDGVAVMGSDDVVQSVVDASAGASDRLVDVNEEFELLSDTLRAGDLVEGSVVGDPSNEEAVAESGETATGRRIEIGSEDTEQTHVVVYQSEDDADLESIQQDYEDQEDYSDVSASQDGRAVTVQFTVPTDSI